MTKSLNILNGEVMLDYFKFNGLDQDGMFIPFNEAMCVGNAKNDPFSTAFIYERARAHNVSLTEYAERTLKPLKPLLEILKHEEQRLILWFDEDMFCQINLLTIMAYLDQKNYDQIVTLNLVNHDYTVRSTSQLSVSGFFDVYKQVLVNKTLPSTRLSLSIEMVRGIQLYLKYKSEQNEIINYIKAHPNLETKPLVGKLLNTFKHYGLGDLQYLELINTVRDF